MQVKSSSLPSSIPSATSWAGNATGLNLCFIQRADGNIKFVINPQINGEATLSTQSTYSIRNIPPGAKIKWTYTFTPTGGSPYGFLNWKPLVFVNGDSSASVIIQRGKYPVTRHDSIIPTPATPWDSIIVMQKGTSTKSILYSFYTGIAVLKATITSGGYSYIITKRITLSSNNTAIQTNNKLDITKDELATFDAVEGTTMHSTTSLVPYRLRHENPIHSDNIVIHIDKLSSTTEEYIPYNDNYELEVWNDKSGLVNQTFGNKTDVYLNCGKFHSGVYQIILIVDGNIVAQSKMLIL